MTKKVLLVDWDGICTRGPFIPIWDRIDVGIPAALFKQRILDSDHAYLTGKITMEEFVSRISEGQPSFKRSIFMKHFFSTSADEDVLSFLTSLKKSHKLVLVTNNFLEMKPLIEQASKDIFDFRFFSCDVGVTKTDSVFFLRVLQRLKVSAHDVLLIDDSRANCEVASTIGIATLHAPAYCGAKELSELVLVSLNSKHNALNS